MSRGRHTAGRRRLRANRTTRGVAVPTKCYDRASTCRDPRDGATPRCGVWLSALHVRETFRDQTVADAHQVDASHVTVGPRVVPTNHHPLARGEHLLDLEPRRR